MISGEMEPTMRVRGGETISLGGGVEVSVHSIPGHTEGSVAYVVEGQSSVFVGDAVQIHGAANHFPGYSDPDSYRSSLLHLRDVVSPRSLYLGHPFRTAAGTPYGVELDTTEAAAALQESIDIEARLRAAAERHMSQGLVDDGTKYSPFAAIAQDIGYQGDPTMDPSPFFTTMHGYRTLFAPEK